MLKRSILVGVFLFLASALVVACDNREPVGVPPAATPSAATTGTATATAVAAAIVSPSLSLTTTVELTATATVTATLPSEVVVLGAVNIRSGPGTDYPIVGYVAGDNWLVTGRSADGLWWRIKCPKGTPSDECWITADEESVAAGNATAAPVAAAPPLPTATLEPTAIPCVVSAGPGWATYQVVSGDTLSSIEARFGGSVSQIMTANCLTSDTIVAGSNLWVPAREVTIAPSQPGTAQPPDQSPRLPDGIAPSLPFENPNVGTCRMVDFATPASTPEIVIGSRDDDVWELLETVCMYVRGFDAGQTPVVIIQGPDKGDVDFEFVLIEPEEPEEELYAIVSFVNRHSTGEFRAVVQYDAAETPTPLVIRAVPASRPRLKISTDRVTRGVAVVAEHTAFPGLQPFFLYGARENPDRPCESLEREGYDTSGKKWCFIKPLGVFLSPQSAVSQFQVATANLVPGGDYLVYPGVTVVPTPEIANRFHVDAN